MTLPSRNPALAREVTVVPQRSRQVPLAIAGIATLSGFLAVHTWKDLTAPVAAWYFRSTPVWLLVMGLGSIVYLREARALRASGRDLAQIFATLPPE